MGKLKNAQYSFCARKMPVKLRGGIGKKVLTLSLFSVVRSRRKQRNAKK